MNGLDVEKCYLSYQLRGEEICSKMIEAIQNLGFGDTDIERLPVYSAADFNLIKDPYTAEFNLVGVWLDSHKHQIGNIQFLGNGSFYAEYDVVKQHPKKSQWFVEAMTAWGKDGKIKTEAKLLPSL